MPRHRNTRKTFRSSDCAAQPPGDVIERLESRTLLAATPTLLINPSPAGGYVELGENAVFMQSAARLHVTNGTAGGTFLVRTFGRMDGLTRVGGDVYFATDTGVWRTDGTTAGTMQLLPIVVGPADVATAYGFTAIGEEVFFYASKPGVGSGIWKTDGTPEGTTFVKEVAAEGLTGAGGTLFFIGNSNEEGKELWKSDGTAAGTVIVKDIHPGFQGSMHTVAGDGAIAAVGDKLVFKAHDGTSSFFSLWSSDGSEAGTVKISSVPPNYDFTTIGDVVYFGSSNQLWKSNGTAAGTALVKSLGTMAASQLLNADGTLYFAGPDGDRSGSLWKSDGSAGGTVRVAGPAEGKPFHNLWDLSNADGTIGFIASDPAVPSGAYSLWTSDGTTAGTIKVRDTFTGGMQGAPGNVGSVGSVLLFTANDGVGAQELWAVQTATPPPAPQARARGPAEYNVSEGGTLALHGYTSTNPLPGQSLTYAWDLDNDGVFGETGTAAARGYETGTDPTFNAAGLDGPSTHVVRFRISDSTGYTSTDSADVTIRDAPPVLNVSGAPAVMAEGSPYSLFLSSSDSGPDAITEWFIDWGDGSTQTLPGGPRTVQHDYPDGPGTYGIRVIARDDGGGEYLFTTAAAYDSEFGTGGVVTSDVSDRDDSPRGLAVQRDGKIVTVSTIQMSGQSGDTSLSIKRYNPDGTLDATFGTGGRVMFRPTFGNYAGSVAIQPDGRIVVVGHLGQSSSSNSLVMRLLPDGSLDPSFGAGAGYVTQDFGSFDFLYQVVIAPDEDIIVGGAGSQMMTLARFNPDGSLDAAFNGGGAGTGSGALSFSLGNGINDLLVQPDGKILALPAVATAGELLVLRLNLDGSYDNTFDGDGRASVSFGTGTTARGNSLALAPDGRVFATATLQQTGSQSGGFEAGVARLTSGGALDPTFAAAGRLRSGGMLNPFVRLLPDGRFWLGGSQELYSNRWVFLIDRYLADGAPDTTFAPNGRYVVDVGANATVYGQLNDMALQGDGAPLLYGGTGSSHNPIEALVRLEPPGPSVRVVDADTPDVAIAAPPTTPEGATYTLGLSGQDDDSITEWVVNWGDGSVQVVEGDSTSVTHVYADGPRSFVIKASAIDGDQSIASVSANVSVTNVPPTITVTGGDATAEGSPYTVQFSATDPGADTITGWIIDWGDSSTQSYAANATSAQHTYMDDGDYTVTVKATDEDGTFPAAAVTASITNVAPTLDPIGDRSAAAAAGFRLTFTARDVVPEVFSGTIDWGDGSAPTPFAGSPTAPVAENNFAVDHTYETRGTYIVIVNLSDGAGGTAQRTAEVEVRDLVARVFEDQNGNGVRDVADPGRAGITAFLDLDRDGALDAGEPTGTTDAFGDALFDGLAAGTYAARVVVPPNWHLSTPVAGFVDATPGSASAAAAFGLSQVAAASGFVFNDANANGVRDEGEGPLSLTVRARRLDTGTTVNVTPDSSGFYRFAGLLPGRYLIELTPTSGVVTAPHARRGHLLTVTGVESEFTGLDIGFFNGVGASISGSLYRDINGNGTRDANELGARNQTVYIDVNNNSVCDPDELSAVTGFAGGWSIGRLPAGTYHVRQVLPPGSPAETDPNAFRVVTVALGQGVSSIDLARPYERTHYIRRSGSTIFVYDGSDSGQFLVSSTPASNTNLFTVSGSSADDWFIIDWTFGDPIPAGGLHLDGLDGAGDAISVIGTPGVDTATFAPGGVTMNGRGFSYAGIEGVTFDGRGGWDDVTITGGPNVAFAGTQHLQSLDIAAGASAVLPANGSHALLARELSTEGKLDLADNDLLIDYTGASPYAAINNLVVTGRSTGTSGIITTATALNDTVLAVVDNAQFGKTAFNGIPIDGTTLIGKYTYFGDANLDGQVTGDDYLNVDANLGLSGAQWFQGDFNFSGTVTGDDYLAIDANLGKGTLDALAFADDQEAMIEVHAARYGGESYVKAVERAMKGDYGIGTTKKSGAKSRVK